MFHYYWTKMRQPVIGILIVLLMFAVVWLFLPWQAAITLTALLLIVLSPAIEAAWRQWQLHTIKKQYEEPMQQQIQPKD